MAVVYQHMRKDTNEIFYIGIGDNDRPYEKHGRNQYWHNIVNKYGYELEILIEDISWELAIEFEIFLIAFYGRKNKKLGPLVNLTDGGEGTHGYVASKETRKKMSDCRKGKKLLEKTKNKISESKKGSNHHMYGKKLASETIEKIKKAWTEERKKLHSKKYSGKNSYWYGKNGSAAPMFGKKQSEKHREAIKKYMNSDRNPAKHIEIRKKFSESKMGEKNPRAKKINQYTIEGHYVKTWNSIADAKRELNIFHIDQVCLGNRKIAGGYIWKYKN
jgi:hypothetical protein